MCELNIKIPRVKDGVSFKMLNEMIRSCENSVCSRNRPQPCLDPPKSEWHEWINEAGKCIRENTASRTKFRGGVRVQACHAAV